MGDGKVPYGYVRDNDFKLIVPEPVQAVVMRRIFELHVTGRKGIKSIANILNAEDGQGAQELRARASPAPRRSASQQSFCAPPGPYVKVLRNRISPSHESRKLTESASQRPIVEGSIHMFRARTSRSRAFIAVGALLALGLLGAACGSEDDSVDAAAQTDQAAEQADTSAAEFCDTILGIESTFAAGPEVDFESASEEEIQAALEEFSGVVEPLLQDAEENAPEEVAGSVDVGVAHVRQALETGDESALETDEFRQAEKEIDEWTFDNCDVERVDVAAVDYGFEGVPETIPADTTVGFNYSNEGNEMHEMILLRKNPDTTESAEELLRMPERKAMNKVAFVGASWAPPGQSDASFMQLEAGDYMMVCFIPTGTTGEGQEGDGPPHFTEGMFTEFTVE